MHHFHYEKNELMCEQVRIGQIAAEVGTPFYLYSEATIVNSFDAIDRAFAGIEHLICFAVKANSNPAILSLLGRRGAGADVVSGGELYLALKSGVAPEKIVFAGVGKTASEIEFALEQNILSFHVESLEELELIDAMARARKQIAPIGLRLNPNIDIHGHPYISTGRSADKFGIEMEQARALCARMDDFPNLELTGLHVHVGSMIQSERPYVEISHLLRDFLDYLNSLGRDLNYVDIGGGLSVHYKDVLEEEKADSTGFGISSVVEGIRDELKGFGCRILFEPGRALVAQAGILVTSVLYRKVSQGKSFVIVDAGMNDLLRPSLYQAYHEIVRLKRNSAPLQATDVVGPICESGDFFARDRQLPQIERGDLLALMTTGAYGFTLSSNYNARLKPAEVLVHGANYRIIRPRQKREELWPDHSP